MKLTNVILIGNFVRISVTIDNMIMSSCVCVQCHMARVHAMLTNVSFATFS